MKMNAPKGSQLIAVVGFAMVACSLAGIGGDFFLRYRYSIGLHPITIDSNLLLAAFGAFACAVSWALNKIEERISRIEKRSLTEPE
jgi:hypothetical protein